MNINIKYLRGGYGKVKETPRQITDIINENLKAFITTIQQAFVSIEQAFTAVETAKKVDIKDTAIEADYTLVLEDAHKYIDVDSAVDVTVTVPKNIFPKGTGITLEQVGTGKVIIAAEDGDVVMTGDVNSYGQNAIIYLLFKDTNNVNIIGGDV